MSHVTDQRRSEHYDRVVRTVKYNTGSSGPEAIDADHIRVHLCANAGYPPEAITRAIADALEAGDLIAVEGGYVVAEETPA